MSMSANLHVRINAQDAVAVFHAGQRGQSFSAVSFFAENNYYPESALIYPHGAPHDLVAAVAAAHNAVLAALRIQNELTAEAV